MKDLTLSTNKDVDGGPVASKPCIASQRQSLQEPDFEGLTKFLVEDSESWLAAEKDQLLLSGFPIYFTFLRWCEPFHLLGPFKVSFLLVG